VEKSTALKGERLVRKTIELGLAGDLAALRLLLDRILPPRPTGLFPFRCRRYRPLQCRSRAGGHRGSAG
jgi:hypothetical protein